MDDVENELKHGELWFGVLIFFLLIKMFVRNGK